MHRFYVCRVIDGRYLVGVTTDGRDFAPVATFDKPADAIRYADMRQMEVSPLREVPEQQAAEQLPGAEGLLGAAKGAPNRIAALQSALSTV